MAPKVKFSRSEDPSPTALTTAPSFHLQVPPAIMHLTVQRTLSGGVIAIGLMLGTMAVTALSSDDTKKSVEEHGPPAAKELESPPTEQEALGRARLLHEAFHATLQYVHHEYYRQDEQLPLPAATLERVFKEVATRQHVKLRWLAVNATAMNVEHSARDDFEN